MIRVFYTSDLTNGVDRSMIENILCASRKNNERDDITGFLILHENKIMQLLEDPEDEVEACVKRIAQDPRHRTTGRIMKSMATQRAFKGWSMGCANIEDMSPAVSDCVRDLYQVADRVEEARSQEIHWESQSAGRLIRSFLTQFSEFNKRNSATA
ncbi:MAG: BLUF domain-containing protein [Paracoccaceae bacterium]